MKDGEAALELLEREGADCCERDFDTSLDDLVARDEALLRTDGFTAERPLKFVVGFDGADNFTHVTLRLTDYSEGVAAESELKVKQLAVAMGDDHFPRLEKIIAPRIGPAASARTSVAIGGVQVPAKGSLCLDLSAARSAYGRRHGKPVHCKCTDVHATLDLVPTVNAAAAFAKLKRVCLPNSVAELKLDAYCPTQFPFKCRRPDCTAPVIRDAAQLATLKAELAALKANKTVAGKKAYAAAIAAHADVHGQQRPFEPPVTDFEPMEDLVVDLLHAMDLNIPKVCMKYSVLDPAILTPDMREGIADFFSEIGCSLDIREKGERDRSRKWFHGSVWHYDFVLGANRKSLGLYGNIFQMCLIVYGSAPAAATTTPARIVDDFSDSEDEEDAAGDEEADLESDEVMAELRQFFGANAAKVKSVLKMWNAYADLYNAVCDPWMADTDAYRDERAFWTLKAADACLQRLNDVSERRHKSWYPHLMRIAALQMRVKGDLWRFSTRCVEGRGGQIKRIARRMVCWRRRCSAYKRSVKARGGGTRVITQSYNSTPERQLMRQACKREDRGHKRPRSRLATTGRKTLARVVPKSEDDDPQGIKRPRGDVLAVGTVKRLACHKR